tara:strand:+ start:202 stop:687 length:486 start_codon:yes stop_codon:yes gene_type:complete
MDADGVARLKERIEALELEVELLKAETEDLKGDKQFGRRVSFGMVGVGVLGFVGQLLRGIGQSIWPLPCDFCSDTVTERYLIILATLLVVTFAQILPIVILDRRAPDPPPAAAPTPTPTPEAPAPAASTPAAPPVPYNPASAPPVYEAPAAPPTPDFSSYP